MSGPGKTSEIDFSIGQTLRQLRVGQGLSAKALAEKANISTAMVSRIENGQVSASISSLSALADALGESLVRFFGIRKGDPDAINWFKSDEW